ncbi:hypothetical protein GCM10027590_09840 [Nocardiopsis nanhaiensis]
MSFIWSVADLLRGDYKQSEYGKAILPFVVLRRLDCVLEPKKKEVLAAHEKWKDKPVHHEFLLKASGRSFYNTSPLTFERIAADPSQAANNLGHFINAFSENAREVLEKYEFPRQIQRLDGSGLLYQVVGKFADLDLSPERVSNVQMGYVFEELIRKFSEISNETAGEHFTPREVIKLMTALLLEPDKDSLREPGVIKEILDPACGTGGMLTETYDYITAHNPDAKAVVFGQELNPESWAICRSDLMIKGQDPTNIRFGNSFSDDRHRYGTFDYMLANPPFGVEWKKVKDEVETEHERGHSGRFGAGLPRINDGSLLFLQHMISKMKPVKLDEEGEKRGGSRIAIVFNGSPLFTGAAGSGESEIRRWILENDWLEAIVALPDQLFYNTGISTYFWVLTNRKDRARGQGEAGRRPRALDQDAQVPGREAQGDRQGADHRADPAVHGRAGCGRGRRAPAARQGEGVPQRGLRLPAHHRGTAAEAALRGHRGDPGGAGGSAGQGQEHRQVRAEGGAGGGAEAAGGWRAVLQEDGVRRPGSGGVG